MIDNNKIVINGWKETSNGRILDYYFNTDVKKKKKFTNEEIEYINELKEINISLTKAKRIIKERRNFLISRNTISKIWNNEY